LKPYGQALREACREYQTNAKTQNDPQWLFFHLFGDPRAKLKVPKRITIRDIDELLERQSREEKAATTVSATPTADIRASSASAPAALEVGEPGHHTGSRRVADAVSNGEGKMKDFFISYNKADKDWATWIAWTLEEANYSVVIQAWDFRPGSDFVQNMHKALQETRRTILVLSDEFLTSTYTAAEWSAAFTKDPVGAKRLLIPVRVRECQPDGLLTSKVYVDLVGLSEQDAKSMLLDAFSERTRPKQAPHFPGARVTAAPVRFPGNPS
jgi:hypothetical protein